MSSSNQILMTPIKSITNANKSPNSAQNISPASPLPAHISPIKAKEALAATYDKNKGILRKTNGDQKDIAALKKIIDDAIHKAEQNKEDLSKVTFDHTELFALLKILLEPHTKEGHISQYILDYLKQFFAPLLEAFNFLLNTDLLTFETYLAICGAPAEASMKMANFIFQLAGNFTTEQKQTLHHMPLLIIEKDAHWLRPFIANKNLEMLYPRPVKRLPEIIRELKYLKQLLENFITNFEIKDRLIKAVIRGNSTNVLNVYAWLLDHDLVTLTQTKNGINTTIDNTIALANHCKILTDIAATTCENPWVTSNSKNHYQELFENYINTVQEFAKNIRAASLLLGKTNYPYWDAFYATALTKQGMTLQLATGLSILSKNKIESSANVAGVLNAFQPEVVANLLVWLSIGDILNDKNRELVCKHSSHLRGLLELNQQRPLLKNSLRASAVAAGYQALFDSYLPKESEKNLLEKMTEDLRAELGTEEREQAAQLAKQQSSLSQNNNLEVKEHYQQEEKSTPPLPIATIDYDELINSMPQSQSEAVEKECDELIEFITKQKEEKLEALDYDKTIDLFRQSKIPYQLRLFKVNVRDTEGNSQQYDVCRQDTAENLKKQIHTKTGLGADYHRLIFGRRQLEDKCTLEHYDITKGDTIISVRRLLGN